MPSLWAHQPPSPVLHESFRRGAAPFPDPTPVEGGLHLGFSPHRVLTGHAFQQDRLRWERAGEELTVQAIAHGQQCSRAFIHN